MAEESTALGMAAGVSKTATGGTALGKNASVTAENSVAIGAYSKATEANTVSVGNEDTQRQITYVADGEVSAASTDAINGRQLWGVQQDVNGISNRVDSLSNKVSDLGDEIDSVGAISSALAGLHPLDYDGTGSKFQLAAAMGSYDGTQAAAIGGFYHFNEDVMMSLGGATSFGGDNKSAFNVGVTFRVGQGGGHKAVPADVQERLDVQEAEIAALKAQVEALLAKDAQ